MQNKMCKMTESFQSRTMMDGQGKNSFAAPKPRSSKIFEECRCDWISRKKNITTFATNEILCRKIEEYAIHSGKSKNAVIQGAIASRNQELLNDYFEGISEEKFILLFPLIPIPVFRGGRKIINYTSNPTAKTVASIFATASGLTTSQYINQAVCRILASSS